jgi:hypothetical protein
VPTAQSAFTQALSTALYPQSNQPLPRLAGSAYSSISLRPGGCWLFLQLNQLLPRLGALNSWLCLQFNQPLPQEPSIQARRHYFLTLHLTVQSAFAPGTLDTGPTRCQQRVHRLDDQQLQAQRSGQSTATVQPAFAPPGNPRYSKRCQGGRAQVMFKANSMPCHSSATTHARPPPLPPGGA